MADRIPVAVSVILPVYNAREFVAEAVRSVLSQTHQNFELIAIDDGSTDGSGDIVAELARADKRIRFFRRENRGVAATANECIRQATYDLIVRLDADDVMLPSRLERQALYMHEHPEISVATSYAWLIDRHDRVIAEAKPEIDIDRGIGELNPGLFVNLIQPATIFRKKDIEQVGGYSHEYRFAEDRELWGRLVVSGYRLGVQPEFLVKQRLHGASLTADSGRSNMLTCLYIDQNIVRSLQGQPRISFEAYANERSSRPWSKRLAQNMDEISLVLYKKATRDFAERHWIDFLAHVTGAICMNPRWGYRIVQKRRNIRGIRPGATPAGGQFRCMQASPEKNG